MPISLAASSRRFCTYTSIPATALPHEAVLQTHTSESGETNHGHEVACVGPYSPIADRSVQIGSDGQRGCQTVPRSRGGCESRGKVLRVTVHAFTPPRHVGGRRTSLLSLESGAVRAATTMAEGHSRPKAPAGGICAPLTRPRRVRGKKRGSMLRFVPKVPLLASIWKPNATRNDSPMRSSDSR